MSKFLLGASLMSIATPQVVSQTPNVNFSDLLQLPDRYVEQIKNPLDFPFGLIEFDSLTLRNFSFAIMNLTDAQNKLISAMNDYYHANPFFDALQKFYSSAKEFVLKNSNVNWRSPEGTTKILEFINSFKSGVSAIPSNDLIEAINEGNSLGQKLSDSKIVEKLPDIPTEALGILSGSGSVTVNGLPLSESQISISSAGVWSANNYFNHFLTNQKTLFDYYKNLPNAVKDLDIKSIIQSDIIKLVTNLNLTNAFNLLFENEKNTVKTDVEKFHFPGITTKFLDSLVDVKKEDIDKILELFSEISITSDIKEKVTKFNHLISWFVGDSSTDSLTLNSIKNTYDSLLSTTVGHESDFIKEIKELLSTGLKSSISFVEQKKLVELSKVSPIISDTQSIKSLFDVSKWNAFMTRWNGGSDSTGIRISDVLLETKASQSPTLSFKIFVDNVSLVGNYSHSLEVVVKLADFKYELENLNHSDKLGDHAEYEKVIDSDGKEIDGSFQISTLNFKPDLFSSSSPYKGMTFNNLDHVKLLSSSIGELLSMDAFKVFRNLQAHLVKVNNLPNPSDPLFQNPATNHYLDLEVVINFQNGSDSENVTLTIKNVKNFNLNLPELMTTKLMEMLQSFYDENIEGYQYRKIPVAEANEQYLRELSKGNDGTLNNPFNLGFKTFQELFGKAFDTSINSNGLIIVNKNSSGKINPIFSLFNSNELSFINDSKVGKIVEINGERFISLAFTLASVQYPEVSHSISQSVVNIPIINLDPIIESSREKLNLEPSYYLPVINGLRDNGQIDLSNYDFYSQQMAKIINAFETSAHDLKNVVSRGDVNVLLNNYIGILGKEVLKYLGFYSQNVRDSLDDVLQRIEQNQDFIKTVIPEWEQAQDKNAEIEILSSVDKIKSLIDAIDNALASMNGGSVATSSSLIMHSADDISRAINLPSQFSVSELNSLKSALSDFQKLELHVGTVMIMANKVEKSNSEFKEVVTGEIVRYLSTANLFDDNIFDQLIKFLTQRPDPKIDLSGPMKDGLLAMGGLLGAVGAGITFSTLRSIRTNKILSQMSDASIQYEKPKKTMILKWFFSISTIASAITIISLVLTIGGGI